MNAAPNTNTNHECELEALSDRLNNSPMKGYRDRTEDYVQDVLLYLWEKGYVRIELDELHRQTAISTIGIRAAMQKRRWIADDDARRFAARRETPSDNLDATSPASPWSDADPTNQHLLWNLPHGARAILETTDDLPIVERIALAIRSTVPQLRPIEASVFSHRLIDGEGYEALAGMFQRSPGTMKNCASNARRVIKHWLDRREALDSA